MGGGEEAMKPFSFVFNAILFRFFFVFWETLPCRIWSDFVSAERAHLFLTCFKFQGFFCFFIFEMSTRLLGGRRSIQAYAIRCEGA